MTSPTNEQQRVDVLSNIEQVFGAKSKTYAAVAELIEAASDLEKAVREETEHLKASAFRDISECDRHRVFENRVMEATNRLRAALANVGAQP